MTVLQLVFPFSHDGRLSAPWGEGLGAPGQAGPGRPIPSHPQPRQPEGSHGWHQEPPWVGTAGDVSLQVWGQDLAWCREPGSDTAPGWPCRAMVVGQGPGRGGHAHCCEEAEVRCTHSIAEGPDLSSDGTLGRGVRLVRAVKAY